MAISNLDSTDKLLSVSISLAFPTLIGKFQCPASEDTNRALKEQILAREANTPSLQHANFGGWHSSGDLLEWGTPEIDSLSRWISQGLKQMISATTQLPESAGRMIPPGRFRMTAWANVSRRGNYHRMHNHPNNAWSGVYYVNSEEISEGLSGVLEFYDPRPFTEMVDVPGAPYGQRMLVRPVPGLLVFFPSWLYHFVHPSASDTERISIAFNAAWCPN